MVKLVVFPEKNPDVNKKRRTSAPAWSGERPTATATQLKFPGLRVADQHRRDTSDGAYPSRHCGVHTPPEATTTPSRHAPLAETLPTPVGALQGGKVVVVPVDVLEAPVAAAVSVCVVDAVVPVVVDVLAIDVLVLVVSVLVVVNVVVAVDVSDLVVV